MKNRFYIGLEVPAILSRHINDAYPRAYQKQCILTGAVDDWTPPEALHCTLVFLGEIDLVSAIAARMAALAERVEAATLVLSGPTVVLNHHLVIPVAGADAIAAGFIREFGPFSQDPHVSQRPFYGHVTIARLGQPNLAPSLTGRTIQHSWVADHVALVKSNGRNAQPRYEYVESARLHQNSETPQ